jgi:hypothetical protein
LILNYNKDGASDESSIKVSLYRFETSSDLQDAFVPILGLSENKTENILQSESGVY